MEKCARTSTSCSVNSFPKDLGNGHNHLYPDATSTHVICSERLVDYQGACSSDSGQDVTEGTIREPSMGIARYLKLLP